ncbi:MAG TPA: ABC transporter permease [Thermoanaerobaculia bacterium]|nr:ABC transporter permease [Thermoanaerobaculia bacterium]
MDSWWQDLRFGARLWRRHPGVAALGLLTLALGIGANTAIFSVISGVLLEPLPFPQPEQIVRVAESAPKLGFPEFGVSPLNFKDWREQNQVFASLAAIRRRSLTLTGRGQEPAALAGMAVTGDFFRVLGVRPLAGRLLAPHDDRPGGERVVVLGPTLWHQRFGGDPGIVNRQITLDGRSCTVVGVAPRAFDFPREILLWVPLGLDYAKESRGMHYLFVIGRLKPGVSLGRARTDMSAIAGRLERQYPDHNTGWGVALAGLRDLLVGDIRPALVMLQLAVSLVLLIACANVANLLLARMGQREGEIAMRAALGAGRLRLGRQIVAESVILFAAAGALGLLMALWGTRALIALNPHAIPRAEGIGLDGRVLVYTLLVAVGTGVFCGLLPALAATGGRLAEALRGAGGAVASDRRGRLARNLLVLGEVALALVLLVGAVLLIESFARLQAADPGFKPEGVITARLSLPDSRYPEPARRWAFFQQALERVGALPGVRHAALIDRLPLIDCCEVGYVAAEGGPLPKPGEERGAYGHFVSPDYFRVMRIPLLQGRLFGPQDDAKSSRVVIVNRTLAARLWPGRSPVGQRLIFGDEKHDKRWLVVGVVGDVRVDNLEREREMEGYTPFFQIPLAGAALVVRTAVDPQTVVAPIRRAIRQLDAGLPLDNVQTLEQVVSGALGERRVKTVLLGIFAALALVLAAVGVYGVVSYSVTRRVHEIGIRVALGARRAEVLRMIVRQGMTPVAIGLAAGLGGAYAASRLLAAQLYKVDAAEPFTYLGVALVLAAVALLANWLPARRATRVDPLTALRSE